MNAPAAPNTQNLHLFQASLPQKSENIIPHSALLHLLCMNLSNGTFLSFINNGHAIINYINRKVFN